MIFMRARILLILLYPGFLFAGIGDRDSTRAKSPDTIFVKNFRDQPHLTFEFARRNQRLNLVNPANEKQILTYAPNTRVNFIASLDYRWLSVSLGLFSMGATEAKKKGNTDQFSLRFSFNGKRIWNTNFIQAYQGYYLANPQVADTSWNAATMNYPQRPDVFTFTLFSNLHYCFRPEKFSYRAALWQLDRQEQSAGSFISGISYRFNLITSDTLQTLVPESLYGDFLAQNRAVNMRQSTFTIHGGYIHTFVANKTWFLTLYFLPGIAFESGFYQPQDLQMRSFKSAAALATEFRLITGYNGERWFGGLSIHTLSFTGTRQADLWIDSNFGWTRLFFGHRFRQVDRTKGPRFMRAIGL